MTLGGAKTLILVNAPPASALAERAAWIAEADGSATIVHRDGRRLHTIVKFALAVLRRGAMRVYLVDCAVATVLAGVAARVTCRGRGVLDTRDAAAALGRASGSGGRLRGLLGPPLQRPGHRPAAAIV